MYNYTHDPGRKPAGGAARAQGLPGGPGAQSLTADLASGALVLAAAVLLHLLAGVLPGLVAALFSRPSAHGAALFLSAPVAAAADTFTIIHPRLALAVIPACSGFSFWLALTALLAWDILRHRGPGRLRLLAWLIPLGYLGALAANIARLVTVWHLTAAAGGLIPPAWYDAAHALMGMGVSVPLLIAARCIFLYWRKTHERSLTDLRTHRHPLCQSPLVSGPGPDLPGRARGR